MGTSKRGGDSVGTTQASPASLSWLLGANSVTIKGSIQQATNALSALRRGLLQVSREEVGIVTRKVVALCTEAGPGQLSRGEAQKLLLPLLLYLDDHDLLTEFSDELHALSHRTDVFDIKEIEERLSAFRSPVAGALPHASEQSDDLVLDGAARAADQEAMASLVHELSTGDEVSFEDVLESSTLLWGCLAQWVGRRAALDVGTRGHGDAWFLRALSLAGLRIPNQFAESLFRDGETWSSEHMKRFAEGLTVPLESDSAGLTGSILLNSRLRQIRPRLFLRFPQTLVAEAIGQKGSSDVLVREIVDQFSEPLLRTVKTIDDESSRSRRLQPRKTVLRDLRRALEEAIGRLDYEFQGKAGELVNFDTMRHLAFDNPEEGEDVEVVKPGLIHRPTGQVAVPAQVRRPIVSGVMDHA